MDFFLNNLALGFSVAFSIQNVLFCAIGAFLGSFLGAVPGVGAIYDDTDHAAGENPYFR